MNNKYSRRVWKSLLQLEDYQACEDGRIRHGKNPISIRTDATGVPYVRIRAQNYEVSTLVWTAFCGSPPDGYIPVPFHLNGDIQDCSIENLAIERDRDRELRELRQLMVNDYRQPAWRPQPAADYPHGRVKAGGDCIRCRSALSVDGGPDENTWVWGVGNRICLTCHPHVQEKLRVIVEYSRAG